MQLDTASILNWQWKRLQTKQLASKQWVLSKSIINSDFLQTSRFKCVVLFVKDKLRIAPIISGSYPVFSG